MELMFFKEKNLQKVQSRAILNEFRMDCVFLTETHPIIVSIRKDLFRKDVDAYRMVREIA